MPAADPESVARAQRHAAAPTPPDRRATPPRRGIRQYVSDGWRLGGVALRFVLVNRPVRRFMLVAAVGVTLFTAALAVVAVALRRRGGPLEYELATLAFYYGLAVATTAASVGLAAVATQVLDGRSTEPRDGWRRIVSRRRTIAGWGLVEVAVGVPARLLGKWGVEQLSVILLGFGWELLRFFAIPVIALTGAGTAASARRSLRLVRRRWGDAVSGMVYVWVRAVVTVGLPGAAAAAAGILLVTRGLVVVGALLIAVGVASLALAYLLAAAARTVLAVVIFRYLDSGTVSDPFTAEQFDRALRPPMPAIRHVAERLDGHRIQRLRNRIIGDWAD